MTLRVWQERIAYGLKVVAGRKHGPWLAGLVITDVASKELSCMLNRLVRRPGVEWEQARSPVVWLAV